MTSKKFRMNVDKIIESRFNSSFMNDSKWDKLLERLTDRFDEIFINFKLIYSIGVRSTFFDTADFKPFFIEPILYKEIEWIEFPREFEIAKNRKITRRISKNRSQNILRIEEEINKIGVFELEQNESELRLYAYK